MTLASNETTELIKNSSESSKNIIEETFAEESIEELTVSPTPAENIVNEDSNEVTANPLQSSLEQNHSVSFMDTFDEDIDAPDSVASSSHYETELTRNSPQTFSLHCEKCNKGFQTNLRHKNHMKNCKGQNKVSEANLPDKKLLGGKKPIPGTLRRKNARFEQLKTNWIVLLEGRERCEKCGRNNYAQDDIEKHKKVCKGTLLASKSRYICPHCSKPSRVFNTELAMRRHVSTNHAKEAMEDDWDYQHEEMGWKGMAIAKKHLFR